MRAFHVTSSLNRASITEHGLDWERMGIVCGIAGSPIPETAGVFLCRDQGEADWFVRINNTGGPVDVWAVEGIDPESLTDNGSGFAFLPEKIPAARLTLIQRDLQEPTGWETSELPFMQNPVSPSGVRYRVQAAPVYGISGPPMLGTNGPATHGVLGFGNRHLLRHLGSREDSGFAALVHRDEPGDPIVAESEHSTMAEARAAALTFVQRIEDGTLPGM